MYRIMLIAMAVAFCGTVATCQAEIRNHGNRNALRHARMMPWHADYYHTAYGYPIGLVIPPTAHMQTKMGWGVSQSEMIPNYHQFFKRYPGEGFGVSRTFSPTPNWPSHTDQFGVYYIRGPW
jgi:hypothetical protein